MDAAEPCGDEDELHQAPRHSCETKIDTPVPIGVEPPLVDRPSQNAERRIMTPVRPPPKKRANAGIHDEEPDLKVITRDGDDDEQKHLREVVN